jgi:hypothetical protein
LVVRSSIGGVGDTACLDNSKNSCLIDCVKPKSKESGTQGKFVPTYHYCGKTSHIRPNCYLLKSHGPWNKQVAPKKSNIEKHSSDKYVPPHRRHLSQEGNNFCVRMLTLKLQSMSRSISANEVSLLAITVVSQDTLGYIVIRSDIRSLGSRNKSQRQVSLALNLPCLIILFGKNGNILKGVLLHAIIVVSMATPRPNASE